jgi:hypothetical protein
MAKAGELKRTAGGSLSLEIDLDNEAFSEDLDSELGRIFKKIIQRGFSSQTIMDTNGNKVGKLEVDYEPPEEGGEGEEEEEE